MSLYTLIPLRHLINKHSKIYANNLCINTLLFVRHTHHISLPVFYLIWLVFITVITCVQGHIEQ